VHITRLQANTSTLFYIIHITFTSHTPLTADMMLFSVLRMYRFVTFDAPHKQLSFSTHRPYTPYTPGPFSGIKMAPLLPFGLHFSGSKSNAEHSPTLPVHQKDMGIRLPRHSKYKKILLSF
jgi:hypothetical protein